MFDEPAPPSARRAHSLPPADTVRWHTRPSEPPPPPSPPASTAARRRRALRQAARCVCRTGFPKVLLPRSKLIPKVCPPRRAEWRGGRRERVAWTFLAREAEQAAQCGGAPVPER